jgi:hypothetical protein
MKTVFRILTISVAVAISSAISTGMDYPCDMFAEHTTPKPVKTSVPSKKAGKHSLNAQKAACSQSAQGMNRQDARPCKSKSIPKKNRVNQKAIS